VYVIREIPVSIMAQIKSPPFTPLLKKKKKVCLGIEGCDLSFVGILVEDLLSSLWYSIVAHTQLSKYIGDCYCKGKTKIVITKPV
jgi:hypothetical protein